MFDPADAYDRTLEPRKAVELAREWLLDCEWAEGEDAVEQINLANAVTIIGAVECHYDGGWQGFAKCEGLWSGLTPRERGIKAREDYMRKLLDSGEYHVISLEEADEALRKACEG